MDKLGEKVTEKDIAEMISIADKSGSGTVR